MRRERDNYYSSVLGVWGNVVLILMWVSRGEVEGLFGLIYVFEDWFWLFFINVINVVKIEIGEIKIKRIE